MTNGRPVKKMACGAVSLRRYCPDQVLGVAVQPLSCPRPLSLSSRLRVCPGTPFGPAPSITSQTIFTLHGANDGRLGPKAPACTGQTSWLRRKLRQRSGPVPGARYGVPGAVRSCSRARLDGSDLQEHPAPAALSACVLSSHREDQRKRDTLASVKNLAAAQRTVVQSPASNTKTAKVRAAEKINGGMSKPPAARSPAASAEAASPGGVSSYAGTRRWRRWNRHAS